MKRYSNIGEIKAANKAAGYKFFSPDTMRFFNSRALSRVIAGRYFVTSEADGETGPRRYTVRMIEDSGNIVNVGEFMEHATTEAAFLAAQFAAADAASERSES